MSPRMDNIMEGRHYNGFIRLDPYIMQNFQTFANRPSYIEYKAQILYTG